MPDENGNSLGFPESSGHGFILPLFPEANYHKLSSLKEPKLGVFRNGSVVKGTYCPHKGSGFSSWNPQDSSESVIPVPGDVRPLLTS